MAKKSKKKFNAVTVILMFLLIVRSIAQFVNAIRLSASPIRFIILFVFGIGYLSALVGISKKKKWGSILTGTIVIIDLIAASVVGGFGALGATIMDLLLLLLAYLEYKHLGKKN